jgi:hypothetical protein
LAGYIKYKPPKVLSQKLNGVRGTSQIMTVAIPLKTALTLKALCLEKSLPRLMDWHYNQGYQYNNFHKI